MKRFVFTLNALLVAWAAYSQQSMTLQECYDQALQGTPLAGQKELYSDLATSRETRLGYANRPQVSLNGQWSYQSDVFSLPFNVPGSDVPQIPKSQYQATLGVEQNLYDGGIVKQSKAAAQRELAANHRKVEVDLYKVKEVINSLYFGVLRAQETEKNLESALNTLLERQKVIEAGYATGVLLLSDKASFEKEVLSLEQQLVSVRAEKASLVAMLADKLGTDLPADIILQVPGGELPAGQEIAISRPELSYLDEQRAALSQSSEVIAAKSRPRLSAFARGGFGSPNPYNFFETDLSGFYVAGVRFYWPVFDWGANRQERQEVMIQEKLIENTRADMVQQFENGTIQWRRKWQAAEEIARRDEAIVKLQESIVKEYAARLEGGTVTASDYITALDQLTRATTTARMHELDKAWYRIQYLSLTGNL